MTAASAVRRPVAPSAMDRRHLGMVRDNVRRFLTVAGRRHAGAEGLLLDVAPQDHEGARPFFPLGIRVETLDIDPASGCTHIGDLCARNDAIADCAYDYIVCTEVLEHVLQPFDAAREMHRMLRPGGRLFLTVPFNLRVHGPLPDCWRFTEHGLRAVLAPFTILELESVETPGRPLMPVHHTVVAERPA
jgi:SAM-dependent methyltransferase